MKGEAMGNKYECNKCSKTAWLSRKSRCKYGCGGTMGIISETMKYEQITCAVCEKEFKPRTKLIKCCSPECTLERERIRERSRQRGYKAGEPRTTRATPVPWSWAEFDVDADKRTPVKLVCRVVDIEYPWVDVLAGNAPAWSANY